MDKVLQQSLKIMRITNEQLVNGLIPEDLLSRFRDTDLNLDGCTGLTALPALPARIAMLGLRGCTSLNALPALPAGIAMLYLSGCTSLTALPALPAGITYLNLSGCTSLNALPALPAGITGLNLSGCTGLTALPALPERITHLYLDGCTSLNALPALPAGITWLDLSGCTSLTALPTLIAQLSALEDNDVEVRYPAHFDLNTQTVLAKQQLENAIIQYKAANPDNSTDGITYLLHRFLTESIDQRGGIVEIASTVSPILDAITANPNHLKWIEEIAAVSVGACINQPVAGWSEISAIMSIATPDSILDKVQAARHLKSLDVIKHFIVKLPADKKPGSVFEVEFGNALLREVHKELLATGDLTKPWLGVPGPIAYEGTIRDFVNPRMIKAACDRVIKDALKPAVAKIAEYLYEGAHQQTWVNIAFPQQVAKIKERYTQEKNYLSNALELQQKIIDGKEIGGELSKMFEKNEQKERAEFASKFDTEKKRFEGDGIARPDGNTAFLKHLNDRLLAISEVAENGQILSMAKHSTLESLKDAPRSAPSGAVAAAGCVAKVASRSKTCQIL